LKTIFSTFKKLRILSKSGLFLLLVCLLYSCRNDNECVDVDYGSQHLSDSSRLSYAYKGGETLIFLNSSGQELALNVKPDYGIQFGWRKYEKVVSEGPCAGESTIKSAGQVMAVNIESDSLNYFFLYEHWVNTILIGTNPIYFDVMRVELFKNWGMPSDIFVNIAGLIDPKGNEAYFDTIPNYYDYTENISLNDKSFENVYSRTTSDSSTLYFNYDFGLVGFKDKGNPMWVLDRIE